MADSIDHEYFGRRAREEIERGEQAADAIIAEVHYEMARRYSILASDGTAKKPLLTLVSGTKGQLAA